MECEPLGSFRKFGELNFLELQKAILLKSLTLLEVWKGGIFLSLLGYHMECEPLGFLRKFVELNFLGLQKTILLKFLIFLELRFGGIFMNILGYHR
ncbi:MAG TPA: hypothetical protein HA283_06035 [Nanoarchaeota archaeon]|nr:hypothetical protein [Nanoarchaeota archaeon]HIH63830.1 hypothetical protein [Nanoarchaeota archaeon]HIJ09105.1 hypothetical protein [Nanoarchaeota archaeon]